MDDQLITQLGQRITENHQHLCERLDDLADAVNTVHSALAARLEAHEAYHAANEHKWGLVKLAARHPFRLAGLAFAAAVALTASTAGSSELAGELVRKILQLLGG